MKKPRKLKKAKIIKEPNPAYNHCIGIYCGWIMRITGVKAKLDATQGKALKYIISYLKSIDEDPKKITEAWNAILFSYDRWDAFHKKQLKLTEINSNLLNIIHTIKNGKQSITAAKSIEQQRNEIINSPDWENP